MIIHGKLRNRLLGWLLSMMLIVGGLLMIDAWATSQRSAQRAFDNQLEDALLAMSEAIQWQDDKPRIIMPPAALQILSTSPPERVFYRLIDDQGRVLANNLDMSLPSGLQREAAEGDVWQDMRYQGVDWRFHTRSGGPAGVGRGVRGAGRGGPATRKPGGGWVGGEGRIPGSAGLLKKKKTTAYRLRSL